MVVAKGARWCYAAVLAILLAVVVMVVFGMILDVLTKPFLVALPLIILAAGIVHVLGVLMMSKIDQASGAKELLLGAGVLAGINLLLLLTVSLMQMQKGGGPTAGLEALQGLVGCVSNIMLMVGLLRIGSYVQYPELRSKAKAALLSILLTYTLLLAMIITATSAAHGNALGMGRLHNLPMTPIVIGLAMIVISLFALVSYTGALTALSKVPDLVFAARRDMLAREYFPTES